MPVVIIMLAAAYFSTRTIIAFVSFFAICKFIARSRRDYLHLSYDK